MRLVWPVVRVSGAVALAAVSVALAGAGCGSFTAENAPVAAEGGTLDASTDVPEAGAEAGADGATIDAAPPLPAECPTLLFSDDFSQAGTPDPLWEPGGSGPTVITLDGGMLVAHLGVTDAGTTDFGQLSTLIPGPTSADPVFCIQMRARIGKSAPSGFGASGGIEMVKVDILPVATGMPLLPFRFGTRSDGAFADFLSSSGVSTNKQTLSAITLDAFHELEIVVHTGSTTTLALRVDGKPMYMGQQTGFSDRPRIGLALGLDPYDSAPAPEATFAVDRVSISSSQ